MEAIIPTKVGMPTLITEFHEKANTEALAKDLDMADELREDATVCIASYQRCKTREISISGIRARS